MANQLYPPYIEGTLPAFYASSAGAATIVVPFSMNRAVSASDVKGFHIKIKTVSTGDYVTDLSSSSYNIDTGEAKFAIENIKSLSMVMGQFYKIQMAYVDKSNQVGYYSTVGVIKYTAEPSVTIEDLMPAVMNTHLYSYTGSYRQNVSTAVPPGDTNEKEYSYEFILYNAKNEVIATSGEQIHNTSTDTMSNKSTDTYTFESDLIDNKLYYIQYKVRTINNLTVSSPKYRISQAKASQPNLPANVYAKLNFENGYIQVGIDAIRDAFDRATFTTGSYIVVRSCSDTNYTVWHEMVKFNLSNEEPTKELFKDFTIEQGKTYVYGIVQYNASGVRSARKTAEAVTADFEDAFLYDGKRQLKIRFNPKVSNFKTDILESKSDTIGSKYPFIFRNGRVEYKEFSISGLISYQQDEDNFFIDDEVLGLSKSFANSDRVGTVLKEHSSNDTEYFESMWNKSKAEVDALKDTYKRVEEFDAALGTKDRTTQLVGYNFAAERIFKLEVLDWLNNGEYKLFRSPSEGNYLVRLMNVTLSPEDTINRLLHNFQATAYEVGDTEYTTLIENNILQVNTIDSTNGFSYYVIDFAQNQTLNTNLLKPHDTQYITFTDFQPNSIIYLNNEPMFLHNLGTIGYPALQVGPDAVDFTSIKIKNQLIAGRITVYYASTTATPFNLVESTQLVNVPARQFIGAQDNILNQINDKKRSLINFQYVNVLRRPFSAVVYSSKETAQSAVQKDVITIGRYYADSVEGYYNYSVVTSDDAIAAGKTSLQELVSSSLNTHYIYTKLYKDTTINATNFETNKLYYIDNVSLSFVLATTYNENAVYYRIEPGNAYHYLALNHYVDLTKLHSTLLQYTDTHYWTKSQFVLYFDTYYTSKVLMSQKDYDNLQLQINNPDIFKLKFANYEPIQYIATIDGNQVSVDPDMSECTSTVSFVTPAAYTTITATPGIVIECGYELEEKIYHIDGDTSNYAALVSAAATLALHTKRLSETYRTTYLMNCNDGSGQLALYEESLRGGWKTAYNAYLTQLNTALQVLESDN